MNAKEFAADSMQHSIQVSERLGLGKFNHVLAKSKDKKKKKDAEK